MDGTSISIVFSHANLCSFSSNLLNRQPLFQYRAGLIFDDHLFLCLQYLHHNKLVSDLQNDSYKNKVEVTNEAKKTDTSRKALLLAQVAQIIRFR